MLGVNKWQWILFIVENPRTLVVKTRFVYMSKLFVFRLTWSLRLSEYHVLGEVFSKDWFLSFPPHCPYDCDIDLLPGATLPFSWPYNLFHLERETMEHDSLANGIIRPSSSPLDTGFFFIPKKDHSLHICIDFQDWNSITVKNKHPLPLFNSGFEPLLTNWNCGMLTTWSGSERGMSRR